MESVPDPRSTIDEEIAAFDAEMKTDLSESTISELICTYRNNQDIRHVLLKVIAISTLYHARVLDIDLQPLAKHIAEIEALDARLLRGDLEVVDAIWNSHGTQRHYPSFATKFCSWHNPKDYAIYDGNAWAALVAYGAEGGSFVFPERSFVKYATFLEIVRRFQKSYGLEDYSLKDIDKFLWRVGGRLLAAKHAPSGPPAVAGVS